MRALPFILTSCLSASLALGACKPAPAANQTREALIAQESAAINVWFEDRYQDALARSPMTQTYYGGKDAQDRLDDASQLGLYEDAALQKAWLTELTSRFDLDRLDEQALLSYRLYEFSAKDAVAVHAFSDHDYVFEHVTGEHSALPAFLMNFHKVDTKQDAEAYIARLKAAETYLGQYAQRAEAQYTAGISLPQFIYPKLIDASHNVITGAPFSDGKDSPLWADIQAKIGALDIAATEKTALLNEAKAALTGHVLPAYEALIEMFARHEDGASTDDGVWKLPRGEDYYAARLKHFTTTDLSADDIHEIGLKDVARIRSEMQAIIKQIGFDGSLTEFFAYLRSDPQFTYDNDDAGRAAYIARATTIIDQMKGELATLFSAQPEADILVKRVEPFREASAFGAFYNGPAMDGSRPGTYYINLKDMGELPIYQMQALAYHEGIPGHHMQIALAQELSDLPKFRTAGGYTAYTEGWALYAERLPHELGLYTDPYQDFGRLSMEIFRAARLVVDTGIHDKKWTRAQAVTYMMENTANSQGDIRDEVDRYIVWPGQAAAYKIGMLKIMELRNKAEDTLGDDFDIREFHDVILASGPVPLVILEELVDGWVAGKG